MADKSTSKTPDAPAPSGWGIVYRGPKAPTKVGGCGPCLSAAAGLCSAQPPHANYTEGCGLCLAARDKVCRTHGMGVTRALDEYGKSLTGSAAKTFAATRTLADAELTEISDTAQVEIELGGSQGAHVDGAGAATGAPARALILIVRQTG